MFDIEPIDRKGIKVIDSKLLHKELEVKSYHADWIRRRIENYGFKENKDYYIDQYSTVRGGKKRKVYLITVNMCKHMAMIENNHTGEMVRDYFIAIEKQYRKTEVIRLAGIETRKSLTDTIQDSGENERMHGHGYSQYTKMVYEITGLTGQFAIYKGMMKAQGLKPNDFRSKITADELKRVELAESLVKPLIELDKQYSEIKDTLKPLFEKKAIK